MEWETMVAVDVACAVSRRNTVRGVDGGRHAITLNARHAAGLGAERPSTADPMGKDGGVQTGQAPPSIAREALHTDV